MPKTLILQNFIRLNDDSSFKITSPKDPNYNCIAWAIIKNNILVWPHPSASIIDGVEWPNELPCDCKLDTFIKLFNLREYYSCDSWLFENGFQKIALYVHPTTKNVTHAARQQPNGLWTSKLGPQEDITHSTPLTIECNEYGNAVHFMMRKNSSFNKLSASTYRRQKGRKIKRTTIK